MSNQDQECCPKFDPTLWDEKILEWQNKKFIMDKVCTVFYMPINFGSAMKKLYGKLQEAEVSIQDGMWLSEHSSKWNMDLYLAVDREVSDAENLTLSGKFLFKVYEGSFQETGKWSKDFENYLKGKDLNSLKNYIWYTTCPKCAKKYGKNYVVLIAQIT